uniref:CHK kinase-like domain-containing protein n=1 Tax=Stomoxys calcitrans TaxID=35570 RepID=A0A1I8NMX9_STOCA
MASFDTSNVPKWLEGQLFEEILKENVPKYKEIKEFKAYAGLPAGENYSTIITRVEICVELQDGSTTTKFFILKTAHESELYKELSEGTDCFQYEPVVYDEIIPAFEKLYEDAGKDVRFGAKYFKLATKKGHLLLEDLRQRNFKNGSRLEGLDIKHAKQVLKKMAEWHAASAVHKENIGKYDDGYIIGAYKDGLRKAISIFFEGMTKYMLRCLHLYENPEEYREKIEKVLLCVIDELWKAYIVDDNDFNVLNHSDCWTNNIMFQYDEDAQLLDTYFVDHAMPKYGSPAQDLTYFILSSLQADIKIKQFDHLIQYYHENLVENLELLKYPKEKPSLKDIHLMLHKYRIWGFTTTVGVLAVALMDSSEMSTFDNFLGESEDGDKFKLMMFTNKRYIQHLNVILPWLLNRGGLDF